MPELPRQSYSRERHGVTDEDLERRNREHDAKLNRVELDVLMVFYDGVAEDLEGIADVTGLTRGQVHHALGVLMAQGMIERAS